MRWLVAQTHRSLASLKKSSHTVASSNPIPKIIHLTIKKYLLYQLALEVHCALNLKAHYVKHVADVQLIRTQLMSYHMFM